MFKNIKNHVTMLLTALLFFSASALHAAGLEAADFGTLQADVTGTIGAAAGIGVALMVISLGWDVGLSLVKKFVKRGAK